MTLQEFQAWLDAVGDTFFDGDYATYRRCCDLPLVVEAVDATIVIETEDQLRARWEAFRTQLVDAGATHMLRRAIALEQLGPDEVLGTFETHMLRGTAPLIPPNLSTFTLHRKAGAWRAVHSVSQLPQRERPVWLPLHVRPPRAGAGAAAGGEGRDGQEDER